ncbi:MAG TPA: SRPBCC domain-containing protein [Candidatus Acidoferrales bacterium]|nr:SRPBCC domain-containing protein [Candidatus Acidoferrales bacterium]
MTPIIRQSVTLPASPGALFKTFLDSNLHTAMTGMPAKTSAKASAKWSAFGGAIWGRNLLIVPGKLIVQTWRSTHFPKDAPDSILILAFSGTGKSGRIDLVHVNVARKDHKGVREGWPKFYWKPWRKYLSGKR